MRRESEHRTDRALAGGRLLLEWSQDDLEETVRRQISGSTLVISDLYNAERMAAVAPALAVVDGCDEATIADISCKHSFETLIAVGGCTALDVGRACAHGARMVGVPTILSTSCISSSTSVIRRGGHFVTKRTTTPTVTVLSIPTLLRNHADRERNWTASGFGDLLSTFGAIAERHFNEADTTVFEREVPLCAEALRCFEGWAYPLSDGTMLALAELLHLFSIVGHDTVAAGSEHRLYYTLREKHDYPRMVATHGKLVATGALLSLHAWSQRHNDFAFFNRFRATMERLGLPISYRDLATLGVTRAALVEAVQECASPIYTAMSDRYGVTWPDYCL